MRTISSVLLASLLCAQAAAPKESVELTAGPDLSITYDPSVWKQVSPGLGTSQSMKWSLQHADWARITVASRPERKTEDEFKRETRFSQMVKNDPIEEMRERRESLAGRDWLVLEFRSRSTHKPWADIYYFLPTDDGHVTFYVVGEEVILSKHSESIKTFLRTIKLK